MIILLRNPIDRTFSASAFFKGLGVSRHRSFEAAIEHDRKWEGGSLLFEQRCYRDSFQ